MLDESKIRELTGTLTTLLEEQIRVYRHLLECVRKEKDILVSANLDDLNENNRAKEALLLKIRALETQRIAVATELFQGLGLTGEFPRLVEIARHLDSESADKLRNIHSVLELLLRRVQEFNQHNETLVQSALTNITGAMKEIKGTLADKATYQKKGEVDTHTNAGQIVSREA